MAGLVRTKYLNIDAPLPIGPQFSKSALPLASANQGKTIFVTDEIGGPTPAFSDGVNWLRTNDNEVVS